MKVNELDESSKFFENKIAPEYISTKVAAQFLGISENALRIKVCRGAIPVIILVEVLGFEFQKLLSCS